MVEQLEGGRVLFANGEIVDQQGGLWGYRLYKAMPRWDGRTPRSFCSPNDYAAQLSKYVASQNFAGDPFKAMAWRQRAAHNSIPFTTSWTRDPRSVERYNEFYTGQSRQAAVVLVADMPAARCVSIEALLAEMPAEERSRYIYDEEAIDEEREVVVFGLVDNSQLNMVVPGTQFQAPRGYTNTTLLYTLEQMDTITPQMRAGTLLAE